MLNFPVPRKPGEMSQLDLKPTHTAVKNYYTALNQFGQLYIDHEMAVRSAFQYLLSTSGRKLKLTLVPEFEIKRKNSSIRVDGALIDDFHLAHGYWEPRTKKTTSTAKSNPNLTKASGITNDPNRADDPQYILRLIGQVITVTLETVRIISSLPPLGLGN